MKKNTLLLLIAFLAFNWQSFAQLTEDFEGGVVPPAGWASFRGTNDLGTSEDWKITATANGGTNAAYSSYENVTGGLAEDWLVTSQVDLTSVTNAELRFFTRQQFSTNYNSQYEVRVSTATQTTHGDFTSVQTWDETNINTTYDVYEERTVNLGAYDGMMIYIAFVHTNDDGDSWYIDDVSVAAASSCDAPSSTSVTNITGTGADLSWSSVALESGGYEWAIMADGDDPDADTPVDSGSTTTGVTTDATSGLSSPVAYDFYVRTLCSGPTTSSWSSVLDFNTPPTNDAACDAVDLTSSVGTASTGGAYSNVGASTETSEVGGTCWSFSDPASESVWFKFTTPGATITISTDLSNGGSLTDTVLTIYTAGDCSDLSTFTEVGCNDDVSGSSFLSEIVVALAAGTYYVQAEGFGTTIGTFDILYLDPSLSVDTVDVVQTLKYFPNPVNDKLNLRAQSNIQNVGVYNMLGQEVMRLAPNAVSSDVDMSALQAGAYFVKVSINDKVETIRIIKK